VLLGFSSENISTTAHSNYSGSREQEDHHSRSARAKIETPISKVPNTPKNRADGVVQVAQRLTEWLYCTCLASMRS
jgi:hypothetical protein